MPTEALFLRALPACLAGTLLAACAAPPAAAPAPALAPEPMRAMVLPPPAAAPSTPASIPAPASAPAAATAADHALGTAVAYADRVRSLQPGELAQEVQRLGDTAYTPARAVQLALALAQTRTAAATQRAQSLLQRVQADAGAEARELHAFARLLSAQLAEQRRADESSERQAQQLREAQRRIDQLNDRLEAVRAIERSLPGPARR